MKKTFMRIFRTLYCLWSSTIVHEWGHAIIGHLTGTQILHIKYWFSFIFLNGATMGRVSSPSEYIWFSIGGPILELLYLIGMFYVGLKLDEPIIIILTQWHFSYWLVFLYCDYPRFSFTLAQLWYLLSFAPFGLWIKNYTKRHIDEFQRMVTRLHL